MKPPPSSTTAKPAATPRRPQLATAVLLLLIAVVGCTSHLSWLRSWSDRGPRSPLLVITPTRSDIATQTGSDVSRSAGCCTEVLPPRVIEPAPQTLLDQLHAASPQWLTVGESVEARPIEALLVGQGAHRVLVIGGIHGDEPEGLPLVEWFTEELRADATLTANVQVLVVRNLNPDGTSAKQRTNKNGVDLNRNFPAANWDATAKTPRFHPGPKPESEPETRIAVRLIRDFRPERVLVMHATVGKPMNNYDGPGRELAQSLKQFNGYAVTDTIGYPTPGSLGSWVGVDLSTPIITLELPRRIAADKAWAANKFALRQLLAF